jgi:hypothetical protein
VDNASPLRESILQERRRILASPPGSAERKFGSRPSTTHIAFTRTFTQPMPLAKEEDEELYLPTEENELVSMDHDETEPELFPIITVS